jgi:beta-keto acid cleavage enzyme
VQRIAERWCESASASLGAHCDVLRFGGERQRSRRLKRRCALKPVVIAVAITGSVPRKRDNPVIPISPAEQIESTQAAFEAGASLVHIHVRNPDESSSSDPSLFATVQEGIRRHCPGMIVQFSTGGRSGSSRQRPLSQARYGLALYRIRQLSHDRVRELTGPGGRSCRKNAGVWRAPRDRSV